MQVPHRALTAAAAAVASATFCIMDANPSLWLFDKFPGRDERLRRAYGAEKCIWITGASSGIGAELAKQLASSSEAHLMLSGRDEVKLEKVAQQCGATTLTTILPFDMDCSHTKLQKIIQQVGPVDCVILNAGIGQQETAATTSRQATEQLFQINALAPIHLTQALLNNQQPPPSQFVVTCSVASKFAVPLSASYAATKCAIMGYFQSVATENYPNVRFHLPCPGPVSTPFFGDEQKKEKECKMDSARCARLIVSSMLMQSGGETWIAQQPILGFLYFHQFFPSLANLILRKVVGPTRVEIWQNGLNLYDPASFGKLRELRKRRQREPRSK